MADELSSTSGRAIDASCNDCGRPLPHNPWQTRPVRCDPCFDAHLREIDSEFLASYGELGVIGRRTVAETCLRGLVLEMPPQRKVLAMAIVEQFLLASTDLIGLARAIGNRRHEPIVRGFLSFRLDEETSRSFFAQLVEAADEDLLAVLGLPAPGRVQAHYPGLDSARARELTLALADLVSDLRATGRRSGSALLLSELAGHVRGGPALTGRSLPVDELTLRPDQVASLVLDEQRRTLALRAVSVDEDRLGAIVDAIGCMTRASSNLIYAFLTIEDEEARLRAAERR